MKNLINRYFIIALLLVFSGCEDFLEENPNSFFEPEATISTAEGAKAFVNGMYYCLSVAPNGFYKNYPATMGILGTDIFAPWFKQISLVNIDTYATTPDDAIPLQQWTGLYEVIKSCNVVLDNVDNSEITSALKLSYKAQAMALRSYCYFMLVRFWGDIPLVTEPVEIFDMQKSSVADVYTQIVTDLKTAIEGGGLPYKYSLPEDDGKITLGAAKMMLAKVYMTMAGWPLKLDKNSNYLLAKELLLDLKDNAAYGYGLNEEYGESFNLYNKHTEEYIFDAEFSEADVTGGSGAIWSKYFGAHPGKGSNYLNTSLASIVRVKPTPTLLRLFDYETKEDKRYSWNIADFRMWGPTITRPLDWEDPAKNEAQFLGLIKYRYTVDPWDFESNYPLTLFSATPMNFPIYRFADVLLMLAEIDNELNGGPTQLALDCINAVRDRARGSTDDSTTPNFQRINPGDYDKDGFFNLVIDERARELCGEGHRWFDLVRTELLISKLAQFREITITEEDIYFKIPQAEININPNLAN